MISEIPKLYFPTFPLPPYDQFTVEKDEEGNKTNYIIPAQALDDWLYQLAIYATDTETAIEALYAK